MDDKYPDEVEFPIDGNLDLHTFSPGDVKRLIPDYIDACLEKRIYHLRIIHGKGKGILRDIVRSILKKHPAVASFWHESGSGGSWGSTVVNLKETTNQA